MIQFSESHALVAAALIAVQREVQPVTKDATNPLLHNSYATLDATTDYIRPILAKNDLALMQSVSPAPDRCFLVESLVLHVSGEWAKNCVVLPMSEGNKGTSAQQGAGSTITYGRRYGLAALLALTTGDDNDGNGQTAQRRESRRAPRVAQSANATKAKTVGDILFPAVPDLTQHYGHPLRDVPTPALETCYKHFKDRTDRNAQLIAKAVAEVLEARREANDFTTPHPALAGDNGNLIHA